VGVTLENQQRRNYILKRRKKLRPTRKLTNMRLKKQIWMILMSGCIRRKIRGQQAKKRIETGKPAQKMKKMKVRKMTGKMKRKEVKKSRKSGILIRRI
jgi:hypothetical protein